MNYSFAVADVFTTELFNGAQVAVFPNAGELSTAQRHKVASELNLWATVFVEKGNNQRFCMSTYTPVGEVSFGSHTAVAAATVLADSEMIDMNQPIDFLSEQGHLDVYVERDRAGRVVTRLAQKVERSTDNFVPERSELAELLSLDVHELNVRPFQPLFANVEHNYLVVPVNAYTAVRRAIFDTKIWPSSSALSMSTYEILMFCTGSNESKADFHTRLVGPLIGVHEDPPVGAAMPALVTYMCAHEHVRKGTQSFVVERGCPDARVSTIEVEMDNGTYDTIGMRVGGTAVTSIRGEIEV